MMKERKLFVMEGRCVTERTEHGLMTIIFIKGREPKLDGKYCKITIEPID